MSVDEKASFFAMQVTLELCDIFLRSFFFPAKTNKNINVACMIPPSCPDNKSR